MTTQIFVNLATADLERSKAFYTALGCTINPQFSDENAACIVWSEDVYFMVLTRDYFSTFTDKTLVDAQESAQVLIALSRESRDDVDAVLAAGLAAGGVEPRDAQDLGFMYSRDLEDPDGNVLECLHMADSQVEEAQDEYVSEEEY